MIIRKVMIAIAMVAMGVLGTTAWEILRHVVIGDQDGLPVRFERFVVPDHAFGEDPEIWLRIAFLRRFEALWTGSIRRVATGRTVHGCQGAGSHDYSSFAGKTTEPSFTLRQYIGAPGCVLAPGSYTATVCLRPDDAALALVCETSNRFTVG